MRSASDIFGDDDRAQVAQAVADAEAGTSAEIVPVVATASGRYDRAEDLAGLLAGLGAMVLAWLLFQREDPGAGGWDGLQLSIGLPMLIVLLLAGFLAGSAAAMRVPWLRRPFTTRAEMTEEVHRRATQLFFDRRIHHTVGASGLLLFVSLYERRAVILADEAVYRHLGRHAIDELCRGLTEGIRGGDLTAALCSTIERAGTQLAATLPRDAGDRNERRDALVTID